VIGEQKGFDNLVRAGQRVDAAIGTTTPKMDSMSAGQMGHSTSEVGDLVANSL
jgi:hypothetical protein